MATKELVDEVFEITNNRLKVIKIITLAKSAIRNNLGEELNQIKQPTLLIWGNNDTITPPFVAKEFNKLIPNSELHFIDHCGHAPMMEVTHTFNEILDGFPHFTQATCCNYCLIFLVLLILNKHFNICLRQSLLIQDILYFI